MYGMDIIFVFNLFSAYEGITIFVFISLHDYFLTHNVPFFCI
jgi:hypothetical protein